MGFFVGLLSLTSAFSALGQNTALTIDRDNQPSVYFSSADATFNVSRNFDNGVSISVSNSGNWYNLDFAAPGNAPLAVGVYENATRFPFQAPNEPGLDISGNGAGCNNVTGRFEVKQIVYGAGNTIVSFHATFVHFCEGQPPASTGEILFNSSDAIPPRNHLTSSLTAFGTKGQPFQYQIRASNTPTAFSAAGLPAGLSLNASTGLISGTPSVEGSFPIVLTATGAAGTASGTLNLTVDPPGQSRGPFTALFLKSEPGDFIGQGQVHLYRESDGFFAASRSGPGGIYVGFRAPNFGGPNSNLSFNAPNGQALEVGIYRGAMRFPTSTAPGLDISGNGSGCNQTSGEFEVKELTIVNNTVRSFRASFVQHCESATAPALTGEIWFHNDVAISSNPYAAIVRDTPFSYQIVANNLPTSYSASGLPPGLTLDSTSGVISGAPTITGTFSVLLHAIGSGSTANGRLTLVVTPPVGVTGLPVVTSPSSATGVRGQFLSYQITATNVPTSFGATGLPSGFLLDSATGIISGMSSMTGTFDVIITATNAAGTGGGSLTLTINPLPPVITSSSSVTGVQGQPFSFQVVATNEPTTFSATGLPTGLAINPATGVVSGTATQTGGFSVVFFAKNNGGIGSQNFTLTITPPPPAITSPGTANGVQGQAFSYQITASGNPTSFGATGLPQGLAINSASGLISGTPVTIGTVSVTVSATNTYGSGTQVITLTIAMAPPPPRPAQLANISTRLSVGLDENVLIGGFIIVGDTPKTVIVRAIGPSLAVNGVPLPGKLGDPVLELFHDNTSLGVNDDWRQNQEQEIIASTVPPSNEKESAIVKQLTPGSYTAIVRGKGATTGVALVEVYDLDLAGGSKLANISTRGFVGVGDQLIGGLIITGAGTQRAIIRAIGPSLAQSGISQALSDPTLELFDSNGTAIGFNNDWMDAQAIDIENSGLSPRDPRESAISTSFQAGSYTAIVRGRNGATGVASVEVYGLQ